MDDLTNKLRELLVDQLDVAAEEIGLDARLIEDLGADSLDVVELVMAIEEAFEVTIDDGESEQVATFGDAVELVRSKLKSVAATA
jgi:acyl carrier protein